MSIVKELPDAVLKEMLERHLSELEAQGPVDDSVREVLMNFTLMKGKHDVLEIVTCEGRIVGTSFAVAIFEDDEVGAIWLLEEGIAEVGDYVVLTMTGERELCTLEDMRGMMRNHHAHKDRFECLRLVDLTEVELGTC